MTDKIFQIKTIFVFLILSFCTSQLAKSQQPQTKQKNSETISGVVLNSETGKPIPHVEIFISGTTSGCITDSLGTFKIKTPFIPCTLVADHVAFESVIITIEDNLTELKILLQTSNYSVDEIQVTSKNKRKKNLRFFYSHFIPENKDKIEILNDSVLIFKKDNMEFVASSKEPLIIVNQFLGYKIKVILEKFIVYSVRSAGGSRIPLNSMEGGIVSSMTGAYYYEPLEIDLPEKTNEYKQNRKLNYYGSYRHFLKALYDNNLKSQGFEIQPVPTKKKNLGYEEILPDPSSPEIFLSKLFRFTADKLEVSYCFDDENNPVNLLLLNGNYENCAISILYPSNDAFVIRRNGTSPNLNFISDGPISPKNFANSLPDDYLPPGKFK